MSSRSAERRLRRASRSLAARFALLALGTVAMIQAPGCGTNSSPLPPGPQPPPVDTLHIRVRGYPPMPVPADNPTTVQGVALGRRLFYDPILSGDSTQACATCHAQAFGFSDNGRRFSAGIDGSIGTRNAPQLVNIGWNETFFWEGRARSLESQALEPVTNVIEMHETWPHAIEKLQRHRDYPDLYYAAFGTREINPQWTVKAIAQFERTIVSGDSRYDRWLLTGRGLSADELNGYRLYVSERAECFHCHVERTFTDGLFQNNGLDSTYADAGRWAISGDPSDRGKFKTPSLRNVAFSAPYMHDGRFQTLEEVVDFYDRGGEGTETVNPFILNLRRNHREGHGLTAQDKQNLIAFLKTLTDSSFVSNPAYASPFE
jgi:cytochrome c peroxidase